MLNSQRQKCLDYLSDRSTLHTKNSSAEFLPYIHERHQGQLISNKVKPRLTINKSQPAISPLNGRYSLSSMMQDAIHLTEPTDINLNILRLKTDQLVTDSSMVQSHRLDDRSMLQHFQVQQNGRYLNEHLQKKSQHKKLLNLIGAGSVQRRTQIPSGMSYNPNYQAIHRKLTTNVIISKPPEIILSPVVKHQVSVEPIQKYVGKQNQLCFSHLLKQITKEVAQEQQHKYKNPIDKVISDISNFKQTIQQTIEKCNVPVHRVIKHR